MNSKIFRRADGSYTLNEYDSSVQNQSVIPMKYSRDDSSFLQRLEILKEKFRN